jgi:hypothetical protein
MKEGNVLPTSPSSFYYCRVILKRSYCFCCRTFLSLNKLELDLLALRKGSKAFALNRTVMDEDVSPVWAFDKTKTFRIVEPLNGSGLAFCHEIIIL